MLSNYYTIRYVASRLDSRLRGKKILAAFSQSKNQLILTFHDSSESLIILLRNELNTLFLHPSMIRAKANSANLLLNCWGKRITSITMPPSDRVIIVLLENDWTLNIRLFGPQANLLVVDNQHVILDAFKDARELVGKGYNHPLLEQMHDPAPLQQLIKEEPSLPIAIILKKLFPTFGSTLVTEVLYRSCLPASETGNHLKPDSIAALQLMIRALLQELENPRPCVYTHRDGTVAAFSIVTLRHLSEVEERSFEDIHEAIRFAVGRRQAGDALDRQREKIVSLLRRQMEKARRTIVVVEEDIEKNDRAVEYERYGSLVMGNIHVIAKGTRSIELSAGEGNIVVPLDAKLTPVQNAQRYFEKAKRSRLTQEQGKQRLEELKARAARAEELCLHVDAIRTKEDLKQFMADYHEELDLFGIGKKAEEREQLPFRIFMVDGGFEVWAGKSSANNDLLTMKHAKPNDLWFHARGSSGSHVVLKIGTGTGVPSKKAKEQAASIAAYYSKMKNATMVPVAMAEKKYVRKPKGAPAGTVVIEREKVIFAEPVLPMEKT
jgi:predicted ribosome quality control (RQC) complex YloA/Tae2 family protein